MTHRITITYDRLSDGSKVFNVTLGDTVFHVVTYADARAFATKLIVLIGDHTVDEPDFYIDEQQGGVGFIGEVRGIKPLI